MRRASRPMLRGVATSDAKKVTQLSRRFPVGIENACALRFFSVGLRAAGVTSARRARFAGAVRIVATAAGRAALTWCGAAWLLTLLELLHVDLHVLFE